MSKGRSPKARTPKKGRPTPRRGPAAAQGRRHPCLERLFLDELECAVAWLAAHPEAFGEWIERRDRALREVYADGPQRDLFDTASGVRTGPEYAGNLAHFARVVLCEMWLENTDHRTALTLPYHVDASEYANLREFYDTAATVASWREGRQTRSDEQADVEARRALRGVRGPADLPGLS